MTDTSAPIVTSFVTASVPSSDVAKRVAAAAAETVSSAKEKGIKGVAVGRQDTFRINPYNLFIEEGLNSRDMATPENQQHIDDLARSIAANGVKDPLKVFNKDGKLFVSNGHSRLLGTFRAIEVYGAEVMSVPVMTEDRTANNADRILTQIVSNSGKPLTPFEQGTVFKKLHDLGWTEKQIAEKAAKSLTYVNQLLELQAAPEEIKTMIRQGKVAPTLAYQVIKATESDAEAVSTLSKAFEVADEAGKTKATAKHVKASKAVSDGEKVASPKVNLKAEMKTFVEGLRPDNSGDMVTFSPMSHEDFERVRKLLGL